MKLTRILLFLMILLLCAGCMEEAKPFTPTGTASPATLTPAPETPQGMVTVPLPGPEGTLLLIDGEPVSAEEYYYQLVSIVSAYEYYYGDYIDWTAEVDGQPMPEFLRQEAADTVLRFRAIERAAEDWGVALSDEEQAAIDEEIAAQIENVGGEEVYQAALESQHLTADLYRYFYEIPELYQKLLTARYGEGSDLRPTEEEVRAYFEESYFTAQHIMVALFDEEGESLSYADQEAAAGRLREAREKALAGEDFTALMAEYNEDEWLEGDSVTFTAAMMPDAYTGALLELEEGAVGDIFQIEDMLVFLKRLPPDEDYYTEYADTLREEYAASLLDAEIEEIKGRMQVEYADEFGTIDPAAIYEAYFGTY